MTTETDMTEGDVYVLGDDIYADVANMQAIGPVARVRLPGGPLAWMVTDHAAIKQIGTHKFVSRDGAAHWGDLRAGKIAPDSLLVPWVVNAGPLSAYGTEHRRLRKLMTPAFTQHRVDALEPMVQKIVAGLLEEIALDYPADVRKKRWLGSLDLRERFCFPVPIATIGALLGVDDDLFDTIRAGADALFDTAISPEELGEKFAGLLGAVDELIARKRTSPDDSLTSALIQANQDGDIYSPKEIAEVVRITIVGGYETTVNLLDQAIFLLLTHPQHLAAVLAQEISWDDVIDETLRYASPAANLPLRFAVADIEIAGVQIAEGEPILVSLAGAGQDPKVFDRPGVFDPTRAKKSHVGFGYGPHRCPGAPLAALEARVALPMLFNQYPRLVPAEDPTTIPPSPGLITNGHARLLVALDSND